MYTLIPASLLITSNAHLLKMIRLIPSRAENWDLHSSVYPTRSAYLTSSSPSSLMNTKWYDPFSLLNTAKEIKGGVGHYLSTVLRLPDSEILLIFDSKAFRI